MEMDAVGGTVLHCILVVAGSFSFNDTGQESSNYEYAYYEKESSTSSHHALSGSLP